MSFISQLIAIHFQIPIPFLFLKPVRTALFVSCNVAADNLLLVQIVFVVNQRILLCEI